MDEGERITTQFIAAWNAKWLNVSLEGGMSRCGEAGRPNRAVLSKYQTQAGAKNSQTQM